MEERLTDKYHDAIKDCEKYSTCYSCRREICYKAEVCEKLGKLEDILEKYGLEVEELDATLKMKTNSIKGFEKLKQDRDTWKRACELASETLKQVMGKPLWIGGNIPTPEVKDSDYFYQQAKTEGNDE